MSHKHKPRRNKLANMLVTRENVVRVPASLFRNDRENLVPRMTADAKGEVCSIIQSRYDSAREQTDEISQKMEQWEKQYKGEFQDTALNKEDGKIFLPKTKEQVQAVHAHLTGIIAQMEPIVTLQPMVSSIWASTEEYKRAKLAEALVNFHFEDLWNFKEDILPKFLKTFLKFSMGVVKISYHEDKILPDLKLEVVDRALLYIDPVAHDVKNARWIIEKYYLTRSEVLERIEEGHWYIPEDQVDRMQGGFSIVSGADVNDQLLKRIYGQNYGQRISVVEDELIEIWDYWQAPRQGLDDAYGVILGGENGQLVRYGRNPNPYKGLPFRAKSFDPHEYQADGVGMVEHFRPFQEVINTFLNMRITDVRKNIITPAIIPEEYVNAQTQADFAEGRKFVRLDSAAIQAAKQNNPNFDLRREIFELPVRTSTQELLVGDLPFILGQGKEASHVSDVFRGQAPPHQATLGQIQEQINQNQGVFRPVIMQVMRLVEEVAEVCMEYFKDPEFYPVERIVRIVGKNRYKDSVDNWHQAGEDVSVRSVSPDELDVDVTINAVNAAEAIASKTFLMQSLERIFQSIGQIPELFQELKAELNFSNIVEMMLNNSGHDIDRLRLSPEDKQRKEQQSEQAQKQALEQQKTQFQMQLEMQTQIEQMKAQAQGLIAQIQQAARAQSQMEIDMAKSAHTKEEIAIKVKEEKEKELDLIVAKVVEQLQADQILMREEARLERQSPDISIGHGNNVNQ